MRTPLDIPPGIFGDDTARAAAGRWSAMSNMRWVQGRPEVIGGWEGLIGEQLTGVCRNVFAWNDNASILNIAFGAHDKLTLWQGGALYEVTPTLAKPPRTLQGPFTVADGSAVVTVAWPGHGLANGDAIIVSNAGTIGRLNPGGSFPVAVLDKDSFTYTASGSADLSKALVNNPLMVTSGSAVVTVAEAGHNITTGTVVTISGASAVGGITPNGSFPVTVVDANSYSYTFTSTASSAATGGGASVTSAVPAAGGGEATIAPQTAFAAGEIDGTGSIGFGTGGYGVGGYGSPSLQDYFPRTWSLSAWGQHLIANPRGGGLYAWTNDTAGRAAPIPNSPANVRFALVAPQEMLFAFGCNEEVSGAYNPLCIRHSSVRNNAQWHTAADTTSREYILPGGGEIVAARVMGPHLLAWTSNGLFLGQFVGSLTQPWRFDRVGDKCGLIGANAVVIVGQRAFWISPDRQFHVYGLGGAPQALPCPIRKAFADNLAASQSDKIVASSNAAFSEIRYDYPDMRDGEGVENSRYLTVIIEGEDVGAWGQGEMARTAMLDAGPTSYPIGVSPSGDIYWHERGKSADAAPLSWFIESADQKLDDELTMEINEIRPDFKDQVGGVTMTMTSRYEAQGDEVVEVAQVMAPGDDKVDVHLDGRYFRVRIEGASAPASCRIGTVVFDAVPGWTR